jgi:uncharacterized damage-inducible protein DinB
MRSFIETWKQAKKVNVPLPVTDDSYYKSLGTILYHVLRSSRGYITWICDKLHLLEPGINPAPEVNTAKEYPEYLEHLLERWRSPICNVEAEKFEDKLYTSNWGVDHTIEAMLEHAVMHPIRHEHQLKKLMKEMKK